MGLCSQATPSGKELRRNRSQIRQIPKAYPKQVKFDLKRNHLCSFSPEIDLTINKQSQPNPGSSPGPVSPAAQPLSSNLEVAKLISPTPGAAQPVTDLSRKYKEPVCDR